MIKVVVLGSGNVGFHLAKIFLSSNDIELVQVFGRKKSNLEYLQKIVATTTNINELLDADVYIVAISDGSITEFTKTLNLPNKLVVHTSGNTSIDAISSKKAGVFYPLQTFSKNKEVDFNQIPICIEAANQQDLIVLKKLASLISDQVYIIDSKQRKMMHLAAVFVNNFVNHLYTIGHQICEDNKIPFEILLPLINETAEKVESCNPSDAQTGPAKRNDQQTIKNQMKLLNLDTQKIYSTLTQSILKSYKDHEKKL